MGAPLKSPPVAPVPEPALLYRALWCLSESATGLVGFGFSLFGSGSGSTGETHALRHATNTSGPLEFIGCHLKVQFLCLHPDGQVEGPGGSPGLPSAFLHAQELTEVTILCSKETFLAKGRYGVQIAPLGLSSAVGGARSLVGGTVPPIQASSPGKFPALCGTRSSPLVRRGGLRPLRPPRRPLCPRGQGTDEP